MRGARENEPRNARHKQTALSQNVAAAERSAHLMRGTGKGLACAWWRREKSGLGARSSAAGLFCVLLAVLCSGVRAPAQVATNVAKIVSVINTVNYKRANSPRWERALQEATPIILDEGDSVQTEDKSKAVLQFSDRSRVPLDEKSLVTIKRPRVSQEKPVLSLLRGVLYFFSRDRPTEVNAATPTANAAVRGTEFALSYDPDNQRTVLTLLDGEVVLSNDAGQITLQNREEGIAQPEKPPTKTAVLDAINIIQWCLYYPAVLDLDELELTPQIQQELAESLAAYRSGDLVGALASYPTNRVPDGAMEKVYYAALLLAVGQVGSAQPILDRVQGPEPQLGRLAEALRTLIVAVKGKAVASAPLEERGKALVTATEWLAESYWQQSQAHLEEALAAARKAMAISPNFAFASARVAELEFSFGRGSAAQASLDRSLALAPRNAEALALKGFLLAAQNRPSDAMRYFEQAITIDGALANAWLGRGLCKIRLSHSIFNIPRPAIEDLQTAAALEPNRSFLRSYLGKAWTDGGQTTLAVRELDMAKRLDPADPTPWLYSALLDRDLNRLNPAVDELEKSAALNTNRSVYRSSFLLDEDRAVRSSSLAWLYNDTGMSDVSVRTAARAVSDDYANFSAHLFLAESYDALRDPTRFNLRYETVWFNELLLANLFAPVGSGVFSQNLSQQEYTRLFERDRLGLSSFTQYRSDGQWREIATQFGQYRRFEYALDVDYQHNDGYRVNNDLDRVDWYSTFKFQVSAQDTFFALTKVEDYHSGDNFQYLSPSSARPNLRYDNTQEPLAALGWHHEWSPESHTMAFGGRLENDSHLTDVQAEHWLLVGLPGSDQPLFINPTLADETGETKFVIWFGELNQVLHSGQNTLIAGGRVQSGTFDTTTELSNFSQAFNAPPAPLPGSAEEGFDRYSVYAYDQYALLPRMNLTAGVAYDTVRVPANFREIPVTPGQIDRSEWLPKAALVWTIPLSSGAEGQGRGAELTVRGIYAWSLSGASFDESFRLEPAQLAGFPQSYRAIIPESVVGSVSGELLKTWGGALDLNLPSRTYLGVEADGWQSNVERDRGGIFTTVLYSAPTAVPFREVLDFKAYAFGLSANQLIGDQWSAGVGWRWQKADLHYSYPNFTQLDPTQNQLPGPDHATLNELWARVQWQHPAGPFVRGEAQWLWQYHSDYPTSQPGSQVVTGNEYFSQINLETGWRFHRNRGEVTLGILNIAGGDYRLDPLSGYPELPHDRVFFASLRLNF